MIETTSDNEGDQSTSIQVPFRNSKEEKAARYSEYQNIFNLILNKLNLVNFSIIYFNQEKGEVDKHKLSS